MNDSSPLVRAVAPLRPSVLAALPSPSEVEADLDSIIASFRVQQVRRYFNQVHWEIESLEAVYSDRIEPGIKLENVAAHSWHVADTALLLLPHFAFLNTARVLAISILHDKLEMYTGDFDPIGPDGRGTYSHAFDRNSQRQKLCIEHAALETYLSTLRPAVCDEQRLLLLDAINGQTQEALFVKAIDKLQALAYVYAKKAGRLSDDHLVFSIKYSRKSIEAFAGIQAHYRGLLERLLDSVAAFRQIDRASLDKQLFGQLELRLGDP